MADFDNPKLSNHITDDIPAIRELIRSLAMIDPATGNTNYPARSKRIASGELGYEFQSYGGESWATMQKWNMDVQKLDGYSASTGTAASTIPVRDASGKIPGDITGNAGSADEAKTLFETLPLAKGGTGATTAADARNTLNVPPKSHASSGGDYGKGTGSMYGHVSPQDAVDSTKTAAGGYALSPKGAADMREVLEALITDTQGAVTGLDTALRSLIASEVAKYLPLTGGALTGSMKSHGNVIVGDADAGYVQFCGNTDYNAGSTITIYGAGHADTPGRVRLRANVPGVGGTALIVDPAGAKIGTASVLTSDGGEVGRLKSTAEISLSRTVDNSRMLIFGGSDANAGALILFGKSHASTPSGVQLKSGSNYLKLNPDGTFTWKDSPVLTEASGSAYSAVRTPNFVTGEDSTGSFYLPSGGTWAYFWARNEHDGNVFGHGTKAGGSLVVHGVEAVVYLAIRIA